MSIDVTALFDRHATNRWERVCVGDLVERVTWSTPDKDCLVAWEGACADPGYARLTYRQVNDLANQAAHGLLAAGLVRGDRLLMVCENSVEGYVLKLGAARVGVVVAPINPSFAPDVVQDIVQRLQPRFAVVDAAFAQRLAEPFAATGTRVDVTIEIGGPAVPGSVGFGSFVEGRPTAEPEAVIHGDDVFEILFTSGTTAMPKGAMLTHTGSTFAAYGFALTLTRGLPVENGLRLGTFLPMMYHVGHLVFTLATFACGGTVVLGRRPEPAAIAEAVEREGLTALWAGSPIMVKGLLGAAESADRDLSSLTVAVYGWAALSPEVLDGLRKRAPRLSVVEIFGQTECIACYRFWPQEHEELYRATSPKHNYVGLPSPLLASKVVDFDGDSLEATPWTPGEAVYRSPSVTAGYYHDRKATEDAFHDGWFHSGDSCVYDDSGLRVMVDRFKDIVKSGGESVSTLRVESVLQLHPEVVKCAVIGAPDELWGEQVVAVVVPSAPDAVSEAELIAFARERLARFEAPKVVHLVDALPETVGGKVMKYRLREQYR
jgi:acyl-CoA synthetase (AMP-forming)/AMP-acid ligase II